MKMRFAGAAFAAVMACGLGTAEASPVYVRYDGIAQVTDGFGIFGVPGKGLRDAAVSIVFALNSDNIVYDTSILQKIGAPPSSPVMFLLGGQTFQISNNDYIDVYGAPFNYGVQNTNDGFTSSSVANAGSDGGFYATNKEGTVGTSDSNLFANVQVGSVKIPREVGTPFSYLLQAGDIGFGSFNTAGGLSAFSCDPSMGLTCSGDFRFDYSITRISETSTMPSLVPLPATAPLFAAALLALGGIGYGMKRRNRTQEA